MTQTIFEHLGVPPAINACGIYTDLGGSRFSPAIWAAMAEVNERFIDMVELLDRTGETIAAMLGVEAARITPGASAAIALGIGACLTGETGRRWSDCRRPPACRTRSSCSAGIATSTTAARCCRARALSRLVRKRTPGVRRSSGPSARTRSRSSSPPISTATTAPFPCANVAAIGHERGIPTFVDAAYINYPVELMGSFTAQGADLVCFSAKYFGGPKAAGSICGRKDLVAAVAALDFTRHESGPYRRFGRAFKMDRQVVVATVLALEEWLAMDHEHAGKDIVARSRFSATSSQRIPDVTLTPMCFTMDERLIPDPVNCLVVDFAPTAARSAAEVSHALASGNPSIRCIVEGKALVIVVETVQDGEEMVIAERVRQAVAV